MRARAAAALAFVVAAAGAENRTTTLRDLPVGTRGRWEYKDGAFVFYSKRALVLRLRAPTVKKAKRSHDHHGTFDASCLVRADPRTVLAGMRGGWGVLETGKPSYWDPQVVDQGIDTFNVFLDKERLQRELG